jgi:spore germination protein YaaH
MSKQRVRNVFGLLVSGALLAAVVPALPVSAAAPERVASAAARSSTLPANARLRREVFGFVNAANLGNPNVGYPSWDMTLLSTVAFFGLHINSGNGFIVPTDTAWNVFHSTTMSNFVTAAHANGVRVIVSLNLHDFSASPDNQVCVGLLKANYTNTITETLQQIQGAGIDGVNIDYEGTDTSCTAGASGDPTTSRDRLTAFTAAFRQAMPNGYLAIDTYSGSAEDNLEFFNVTGLAPSVDAMFVMAYDMDFANATEQPLLCSQYCMNPVSPLNTYRFNVTKSMSQYTALVPASKVILGQPYYGRRACVSRSDVALQYPLGAVDTPTYLFASTVASQSGVFSFASHRDGGDGVSEWDTWWDTDFNCIREQYFDDVVSLGAKYDVVNADNIAGVGLFTLDYGGGAPELWNLIDNKFATPTPWGSVGGVLTSTAAVTSWGTARTDVFVRGTDNALWHRWFDGTSWKPWESLGGVLTSAPGAVSWGANRLDVFVRGTDNAVWHRSWDGTMWAPWDSVGGIATSAPSATSWTAGRLDMVVAGLGGVLWHRSWTSSGWAAWDRIGGVANSDPSVVGSAVGRLDVFVKGTDNALWHRAGDGAGTWSDWESLGGVVVGSPAAASCGAGHLDVFVQGTDKGLWQKSYTGTPWNVWLSLRGSWTGSPGAVCTPGTMSETLTERGLDGALWTTTTPGT